jgi:hypothetical protein
MDLGEPLLDRHGLAVRAGGHVAACAASSTGSPSAPFNGPAGTFRQRTEISPARHDILGQLGIDPPPRIYQLTPAVSR